MIKRKLLERKYFEYDNAFYKNNMNIRCWEQMQYQSLRDYAVDYTAIFCEDINIILSIEQENTWYLGVNDLGYKNIFFDYVCVTENPHEAEAAIESILDMGRIVVFQTASDALHTNVWYHKEEPYTRIQHSAIIIGYNLEFFFYVDSPPMRNLKYFIAHSDNPAVGCIPREELINSFNFYCKVGYIEINENKLKNQVNVIEVLKNVRENYFSDSGDYFLGRIALVKLGELLENEYRIKGIFEDVFSFDLIKSRHKLLLTNVINKSLLLDEYIVDELIQILNLLCITWQTIQGMSIKFSIKDDIAIQNRISKLIKKDVIPISDNLMELLELV